MTVRVVLVDDQTMIRAGIRSLLDGSGIAVVGEASDGEQGLRMIRTLHPQVVLLDLRMPVLDGIHTLRALRADPSLTAVRVLVLTTFDGDPEVLAALRAGADGFIGKTAEPDELVAAIETTAAGRPSLSDHATRAVIRHLSSEVPEPVEPELERLAGTLTPREREVVLAAAQGLDNNGIGRALFISPHTAKTHLNHAMAKLGARDRGQLVAMAYRAGLVRRP